MTRAAVAAGVVGAALLVTVALTGPHLRGAPVLMVVSTLAACLAVGALAVQPWLTRRRIPAHLRLGAVVTALVGVHLVALLVEDPDDALYSMSPDGPTRARMALIATLLLVAVTLLGVLRRRLRWSPATWRFVHGSLAVLVVVLGVGHALLIEGALEGWGTVVLVALGVVGTVGAVVRVVVVLRAPARSPEVPRVPPGG